MTYSYSKCQCGHKACNRYYLSGPDVTMSMGSGFDGEALAERVCNFLNGVISNDAAIFIAEEAFVAGFEAGVFGEHGGPCAKSMLRDQAHKAWNEYEPSERAKDFTC